MEAPDLLLVNATVLTMDPARPRASAVAVRRGRVVGVGDARSVLGLRGAGTRVVDCNGGALAPGFHDAHLHLLALAARAVSVDCTPSAARSLVELKQAVRGRAQETPQGGWVRAWGYDETALPEARHPTRYDLDEAAAGRPVRLKHRSGHAAVLSSAALAAAGIGASTPDPPDGVIERDAHGEPTGLLLEMDDYLEGRLPPLGRAELDEGVRMADRRLLSRGVTAVQDATPTNDYPRWRLLQGLRAGGALTPRLVFLPGIRWLEVFQGMGDGPAWERASDVPGTGPRQPAMHIGPAKVMLTMTTGSLSPSPEELGGLVREASERGFAVAVHAVEAEAVEAAARAIAAHGGGVGLRHRIEHASEAPPSVLELVRDSGATVVANPGFLFFSGDRYRTQVEPAIQPWLYRMGSMHRLGVPLAIGSDAPVELPEPMVEVFGAVARRSLRGEPLGPAEAVTAETAMAAHTLGGACAAGLEGWLGRVAPGMAADLVLLDRDPTSIPPEALLAVRVRLTLVGGRVAWEEGP